MRPVSVAAIRPSWITVPTADLTKADWSPTSFISRPSGIDWAMTGKSVLISVMMSRVETDPAFSTVIRTPFRPLSCTTLVCGGALSWT
jgi:hypothetical protein